MHRYTKLCVTALLLCGLTAQNAAAQDYRFAVPELRMQATVNPNASITILYEFHFQNSPAGHAIDIVDIGTPHAGYKLGDIRAWINNHPLSDIRPSTEVSPGFEVHLRGWAISPGKSGVLRVAFTMPDLVYQDTTRKDYASLRITPTWFGDRYVIGTTHLLIMVQLPKNVRPEDVLHQGRNFTLKAAGKEGAIVGWDFPAVRLTERNLVAVSFPKRDLQRVVVISNLDLLVKWFRESPRARLTLGGIFLVLFGILFFRFSGGTGLSLYAILSSVAAVLFYFSPGWHLASLPLVVVFIGLNEWFLGRRKLHYMLPIAYTEGSGIKRGLTAPEAAVLLELPLAKVLSLVVFGMLKKGILRQAQADPLTVDVNDAFRTLADDAANSADAPTPAAGESRADGESQAAGDAAVKAGVVLHAYERPFLFLIRKNPGKALRALNFGLPMKTLIQSTAARMKGFDPAQTKDYYRAIIKKATEQAAAIGDIPQRESTLDRNLEWILMDPGYPTVFTTFGRPYQPVWTRGSTMSLPTGSGPAPMSEPSMPGTTSFGDVASSFSGWAENTMGSLAQTISPGALNLPHPSGRGFLDLSGVDHVAGDFFQALSDAAANSGRGGGGGGGCACAGCACACACAGGGR